MQRFDGDTIRKIPAIVFLNDSAPSPIRSPRKARLVLRRVSRRAPPTSKAPQHMRVVIEASVGQVFGVLAEEFGIGDTGTRPDRVRAADRDVSQPCRVRAKPDGCGADLRARQDNGGACVRTDRGFAR